MRAPLLLALLGLAVGCAPTAKTPADPESAAVERLVAQGFTLVSDGRGQPGSSVLRFQGDPASVIECQPPGGRMAATDQSGSAPTADGQHVVTQKGEVAAYLIVVDGGGLRGIYVNSLYRTIAATDGRLVASQIETISFEPGGRAAFRNGVTCQAKA
ncbi:MAG: hypothetical protein U1E34_11245 [Amaricoccus sp.]